MKKILLTTSLILFGISPNLEAKNINNTDLRQASNSAYVRQSIVENFSSSKNILLSQKPVDPVYIGETKGPDSKCRYYLVRGKDGKIYECRTCPWGGPYCFREE
ncbi:hypothetical protein [Chamaesiphon polymorphus]|uniref:hypothetical protein n=1 Tax=Chamaesiphon polymorphus TaxID=2107691 RepID=UPI0011B1FAAE|nr:hypothetical protein [Chamaesiphon polymorphus]